MKLKVHFLEQSCNIEEFVRRLIESYNADETRWTIKDYARKSKDKDYFHYQCVRGDQRPPTDKSHRNVGCKAYISFTVLNEYKAVDDYVLLEHVMDIHSGHDCEFSDKHSNPVAKDLLKKITEWVEMGVKPDVILLLAHKWAKESGYHDMGNRRFYVTPDDITNIKKQIRRSQQMHKDDSISLEKLVASHQSSVIHYAPYIPGKQPLLLILMTDLMKQNFREFGNMLFLDATGNTNAYGFPLYAILVRDSIGRGTPAAYIISSSEDQSALTSALQLIKASFPEVVPR